MSTYFVIYSINFLNSKNNRIILNNNNSIIFLVLSLFDEHNHKNRHINIQMFFIISNKHFIIKNRKIIISISK